MLNSAVIFFTHNWPSNHNFPNKGDISVHWSAKHWSKSTTITSTIVCRIVDQWSAKPSVNPPLVWRNRSGVWEMTQFSESSYGIPAKSVILWLLRLLCLAIPKKVNVDPFCREICNAQRIVFVNVLLGSCEDKVWEEGVPEFGFGAPSVRPQILKEGDYGSQRPKGTKPQKIPKTEGS